MGYEVMVLEINPDQVHLFFSATPCDSSAEIVRVQGGHDAYAFLDVSRLEGASLEKQVVVSKLLRYYSWCGIDRKHPELIRVPIL